MAVSESKKRANKNFDSKTYKYCSVLFRKEEYEIIKEYCKKRNMSFNGFIRDAVKDAIESWRIF